MSNTCSASTLNLEQANSVMPARLWTAVTSHRFGCTVRCFEHVGVPERVRQSEDIKHFESTRVDGACRKSGALPPQSMVQPSASLDCGDKSPLWLHGALLRARRSA